VCVLIVPENRRGAALRVLGFAKLSATYRAAPGIADIEARYRGEILEAAVSAPPPGDAEAAFVAEMLANATPEQIAAAFLRQQLASRPVPEDLVPLPVESMSGKPKRRERTGDEVAPGERHEGERPGREPRGPDMVGGVWFTISLGRKQRADPKWLLPMICRAGGVSRRDVGSIRIDDAQTRFEISGDKAAAYADHLNEPGALERGIVISPMDGTLGGAQRQPVNPKDKGKPKYRKKVKFEGKPKFEGRPKSGGKRADGPAEPRKFKSPKRPK
jgi:ATP-dependent RNA helicase DeaD